MSGKRQAKGAGQGKGRKPSAPRVALDAAQAGEMEAARARKAALDGLRKARRKAGPGRDRPTDEQVIRRGVEKIGHAGSVRLGPDLPDTMRRLQRSGIITAEEAKAAALWRADWHTGSRRNALTGSYAERVDGGRMLSAPGEGAVAAWNRFSSAWKAVPDGARALAQSVILYECALETAPGLGERYTRVRSRQAANGALLVLACGALKAFYDRHLGESV